LGDQPGFSARRCDVKSARAEIIAMAGPDMNISQPAPRRHANDWAALKTPLLRFLDT
jgi:hypothetical protein